VKKAAQKSKEALDEVISNLEDELDQRAFNRLAGSFIVSPYLSSHRGELTAWNQK
jgi:hypothetical protein